MAGAEGATTEILAAPERETLALSLDGRVRNAIETAASGEVDNLSEVLVSCEHIPKALEIFVLTTDGRAAVSSQVGNTGKNRSSAA